MKYIKEHPLIMIVIGVIGISLSSIFVRYSQAPSVVTAAYRLLWTLLLLLPVVIGNKRIRSEFHGMSLKQLLLCALSGIFLAAHFVLWFESLRHTSVASSTIIVCTEVIWVALGFCLFLGGRLSWQAAMSIAVALGGSFMIAYSDSGDSTQLYGDILALLAAIAVAVYTLIGRILRERLSTTVYTFSVYTACAVTLLIIGFAQGYRLSSYGWSPVIVGVLLALFSTILGHSIFSWCLKFFSPAFVSCSKLAEPVVASVFAAILFHEIPGALQIAGSIPVLTGVIYYSHIESKLKQ